MTMSKRVHLFIASFFILLNSYFAFAFSANIVGQRSVVGSKSAIAMSSTAATPNSEQKSHLYVPSDRDEYYQGNVAQYLLDLHNEGATFNFCGGMMFQLMLSEKLQMHLKSVASDSSDEGKQKQPVIYPASQSLMALHQNIKSLRTQTIYLVFMAVSCARFPQRMVGWDLSYS